MATVTAIHGRSGCQAAPYFVCSSGGYSAATATIVTPCKTRQAEIAFILVCRYTVACRAARKGAGRSVRSVAGQSRGRSQRGRGAVSNGHVLVGLCLVAKGCRFTPPLISS